MKDIRFILGNVLLYKTSLASLIKTIVITVLSLSCGMGIVRFFRRRMVHMGVHDCHDNRHFLDSVLLLS